MKIDWRALPPAEALDYFRAKGYRIGFDWREVWGEEHAVAFTVAKAMRLDLLQDIRRVLDQAIAEGRTLDWFKKNLTPILQEKGWWGRQEVIDPQTGLPQNVQLGSPRRLRIIYDTNLRAAHAAGRWQQIQRSKRHRPYLRYTAVLDGRTRPQHRAWHGTIRPVDDSFWGSHYPPNGWRCRCTVIQLSAAQMAARGWDVSDPPDIETRDYVNGRTGEVTRVPAGIDPGFAHNPGQQRMAMLSPPPANRPLVMPYVGAPAAAEVPAPRPMTQPVLPPGLPDDAYVDAFLSSFGASADQPALFRDALGDPLVVSRRFFETANGRLKLRKEGREQYAAVLAEAIRDPDEIWHVWVRQPDGTMGLRKRYLRWPAGDGAPLIAVVEVGRDGWVGVTAFNPAQADYLNRQRVGTLAYRRP